MPRVATVAVTALLTLLVASACSRRASPGGAPQPLVATTPAPPATAAPRLVAPQPLATAVAPAPAPGPGGGGGATGAAPVIGSCERACRDEYSAVLRGSCGNARAGNAHAFAEMDRECRADARNGMRECLADCRRRGR